MPIALLHLVSVRGVRRHAWFLVAVGMLAGVVLGSATAAVIGARRTTTAVARLAASANTSDGTLRSYGRPVDEVTRLVADAGIVSHLEPFVSPVGRTATSKDWFYPVAYHRAPDTDRFVLRAGRLFDPTAVDEVLVSVGSLDAYPIGSTIDFAPYTTEQFTTIVASGSNANAEPVGPAVRFRVVGAVADINDMTTIPKVVYATPAYAESLVRAGLGSTGGARLTLADRPTAAADLQAFLASRAPALASQGVTLDWQPVQGAFDDTADNAQVLVVGLAVFAAITALAGSAAVFVIVRRRLGVIADNEVLSALGADRGMRALLLAAPLAVVAATALPLVVAVPLALSARFPFGSIRLIEPHPGAEANLAWLAVGLLASVLLLAMVLSGAAWRAADLRPRASSSRAPASQRPRPLAGRSLGLQLCLDDRASRAGLVGAALGVAGLACVGVLSASERALHDDSRRWGAGWDLLIETSESVQPQVLQDLQADERLTAVGLSGSRPVLVNGVPTDVNTVVPLKGALAPTLLSGRGPEAADEVVLGPELLEQLGVGIGSAVEISTFGSAEEPRASASFRVVGSGLVSTETTEQYAGAAYLSRTGFEGLTDGAFYEGVVVRYADGADRAGEWRRFDARYPAGVQDESSPTPPAAVSQLHQLGPLRDALGAVFAMLFLAITATTLGVAGHRSRRPLAVLRCLGHTAGQSRAVLLSAAGGFAVVSVAVGAAAGTVAGAALWRRIADRLHVTSIVGLPYGWAILCAVAVAGAGTVAILVGAGGNAGQPPARSLRAE